MAAPLDADLLDTSIKQPNVGAQIGDHYEVDHIRKVKGKGKNMKCFIHWKGYPASSDS